MAKKEISNLAAIRLYFGKDSRKVEMSELKALSSDDRDELGTLAKKELSEDELFEEEKTA